MITRSRQQSEPCVEEVALRGGLPFLFPCLEIRCLSEEIRQGVSLLSDISMPILFTSVNGVHCTAEVCGETFRTMMASHRIAAVGEKTAEALEGYGISTELLPEEASQEGLLEAYLQQGIPKELLFFRAREGRDFLAEKLQAHGCQVHLVTAYEVVCPSEDATDAQEALTTGKIDAVLLGSARTADFYLQRIGNTKLADKPAIACISPKVAEHIENHLGLSVQIVAKKASFASMLDGLERYFANR